MNIPRIMISGLGTLTLACGSVGPNLDSIEGDFERDRANAVFIKRSVTDRLEPDKGDNTDWKYVDVLDQGKLTVTIGIDQPERLLEGDIELFDEFGNRINRYRVEPNQTVYVFEEDVRKIPNKYFVKLFAKQGGSPYTVGVDQALPPPPPDPVVVSAPTPGPLDAAPPPRARTRAPGPPKAGPTPSTAAPAAVASVGGKIFRVIPSEDNTAVTIAIKLDEGATVAQGDRGQVYRDGGPVEGAGFTVSSVSGRTAQARVNAPPHKFTGTLTVKISTR